MATLPGHFSTWLRLCVQQLWLQLGPAASRRTQCAAAVPAAGTNRKERERERGNKLKPRYTFRISSSNVEATSDCLQFKASSRRGKTRQFCLAGFDFGPPLLAAENLLPLVNFFFSHRSWTQATRRCFIAVPFELMPHEVGEGGLCKSPPDMPIMQQMRVNRQVKSFPANYRKRTCPAWGLLGMLMCLQSAWVTNFAGTQKVGHRFGQIKGSHTHAHTHAHITQVYGN